MEPDNPQALLDRFWLLSDEDRREFLRLLGETSTAEMPMFVAAGLTEPERFRLSQMMMRHVIDNALPHVLDAACRLAREWPDATTEEFQRLVYEDARQRIEGMACEIGELERAQLKEQRDRKSDPETIRRNVELCDLRRQDPKTWSHGMLARRFDISDRAVRFILEEETKWRALAARTPEEPVPPGGGTGSS